MAVWPELIVWSAGVAATEKSPKKTAMETFAVCVPLLPETVMFMGLALLAERPITVNVLLWPGVIEAGSKAQVAPPPAEQESLMASTNELGAAARIVKATEVVPITTFVDRALVESEKTALPTPERDTLCGLPAASSAMDRLPVREPLASGVN